MQVPIIKQPMPVKLSAQAITQIKNIIQEKNIPIGTYGLRIGIRGGGCSGVSFLLGFDTLKPGDEQHAVEEIPIYIEKKHVMYLLGLEIDYEHHEHESGFIFNSPAERLNDRVAN